MYMTEKKYTFAAPEKFVRRDNITLKKGLNVLIACAGSGKTALLSQLSEEMKCVCISFGEEDNSESGMTYILRGILTRGDRKAVYENISELIQAVVSYLSEENIAFLADNADVITDKKAVRFLELIARAAAGGEFTAVFAGRRPPVSLLSFLLEGSAEIIPSGALLFTREQILMLAELYGMEKSDIRAGEIYSYTGGWCMGTVQVIRNLCPEEELSRAYARTYLKEYINDNIVKELDSEISEYLILISLFDAPDEELARRVLLMRDVGERASEVIRYGLPSVGSDDSLPVLPPLLKNVFAGLVPENKRRELTERAADHYILERRFAEAIRLFETNGNVRAAERILGTYGEKLLQNGEFELVGYCGDIICSGGQPGDPQVLGILAQYYYYSGDYEKMEAAYNSADSMFGRENMYSVYRKLYNGLIRYEKNSKLYSGNVLSALAYLKENSLPLPFLCRKELDILAKITEENSGIGARMTVNRFGVFTVKVDGAEIQCGSKKGSELFAYMIENGGKPIPRDEMLDILWPSNIPNNAVAMLHNIIYGFRKELSAYELENIIMYKNKCYLLDMSMIKEVDRPVLEVCAALEAGDRNGLIKHESVISEYWGKYLGSIDSRWADEKKEYYDRCFIDASLSLAEYYRENGNREKELGLLKKALSLDPYSERIMHDILLCYSALGKPDKAKKTYEDYSELIDSEFGIRPSKWLKNEFLSCFSSDM